MLGLRRFWQEYKSEIYREVTLTIVWTLFCLGIWVLICFTAQGAPAPSPNPEPPVPVSRPPSVVGVWTMNLQGVPYATTFYKEGGYSAKGGSTLWLGQWEMKNNVLSIEEFIDPGPSGRIGAILKWKITITPGTLTGVIDFGGDFSLEKP